MKLGILYLILGVGLFVAIGFLANGSASTNIGGIGRLVVAGLLGLWFLGTGSRKIRIARLRGILGEQK